MRWDDEPWEYYCRLRDSTDRHSKTVMLPELDAALDVIEYNPGSSEARKHGYGRDIYGRRIYGVDVRQCDLIILWYEDRQGEPIVNAICPERMLRS